MSRSAFSLLALSLAVLIGSAGIARADVVYEWTDANGQVHYTDQWVPGAKLIQTQGAAHASAASSSAMQGIQDESKAASKQLQKDEETRAVQADEAKQRAQRCEQEKAEYLKLIESRRLFSTDKSGERHYLSDTDADAQRLKARQAMDADCGTSSP